MIRLENVSAASRIAVVLALTKAARALPAEEIATDVKQLLRVYSKHVAAPVLSETRDYAEETMGEIVERYGAQLIASADDRSILGICTTTDRPASLGISVYPLAPAAPDERFSAAEALIAATLAKTRIAPNFLASEIADGAMQIARSAGRDRGRTPTCTLVELKSAVERAAKYSLNHDRSFALGLQIPESVVPLASRKLQ